MSFGRSHASQSKILVGSTSIALLEKYSRLLLRFNSDSSPLRDLWIFLSLEIVSVGAASSMLRRRRPKETSSVLRGEAVFRRKESRASLRASGEIFPKQLSAKVPVVTSRRRVSRDTFYPMSEMRYFVNIVSLRGHNLTRLQPIQTSAVRRNRRTDC